MLVGGVFLVAMGGVFSVGGTRFSNGQPSPVWGAVVLVAGLVVIAISLALGVVHQIDKRRERQESH
jgi:membrane protein implicated in regulation of membrane protease activity